MSQTQSVPGANGAAPEVPIFKGVVNRRALLEQAIREQANGDGFDPAKVDRDRVLFIARKRVEQLPKSKQAPLFRHNLTQCLSEMERRKKGEPSKMARYHANRKARAAAPVAPAPVAPAPVSPLFSVSEIAACWAFLRTVGGVAKARSLLEALSGAEGVLP